VRDLGEKGEQRQRVANVLHLRRRAVHDPREVHGLVRAEQDVEVPRQQIVLRGR
jgi:hypothetical protein